MSEDTSNSVNEYLERTAQTLRNTECCDSHGNPIGELYPSEFEAFTKYLLSVVECRENPLRCALELSANARKYVVVYACILPLIIADARRTGRNILFLALDSEAGASLEYHAMAPFTISSQVEFATWDELQPKPENGFRLADLSKFWVIGDLDWSKQPLVGVIGELKMAAVQRVIADGTCPTLLLHQQEKIPIIPFPPDFRKRG